MTRKTREEKVLENAESILEKLKKIYNDNDIAITEYANLTKDYKKLVKRFNKIITMNDNSGKGLLLNAEKLKDNVDYTIQLAKKKILNNVTEQRRVKDILTKQTESDQNTIKKLKKELQSMKEYVFELKSKIK